MNYFRTALLLAVLTALFVLVGGALGGGGGMAFALCAAIGMNAFAYWNSDRLALAAAGAREVDARTAPGLIQLVAELARRAGLPMPRLFIADNDQPNAFATGRDPEHAALVLHTGLIDTLSQDELAGVLSHELAHVKNRDTLTMTVTATIAGAISSIAHWGLFFGGGRRSSLGPLGSLALAILAPIAAMIVQMAVSRGREYEADRIGAGISGNPLWLASALRKIAARAQAVPNEAAEAHPAMAHLYIVNPLTGGGMDNLFSTHPNVENRIAALEQLAAQMGVRRATSAAPPSWRAFDEAPPQAGPWSAGASGAPRLRGPWG
ncbi:MAG: zinc metalloprotease HtpX [Methylobacteriaceae bacterium]|nr:zinc metalloprotease HtpX [Methylobacteriaceae bacterium]